MSHGTEATIAQAGSAFPGRLEEYLRTRDHDGVLRETDRELADSPAAELAKRGHLARARSWYEHGRFVAAADDFHAAFEADPNDLWPRARELESRYRAAHGRPRKRNAILRQLDQELGHGQRDKTRVPFLWARARARSGPHPDDRPSTKDLRSAEEDFDQAEKIERTSAPVLLSHLRLKRLRTRFEESDRPARVAEALEFLATCRERLGGLDGSDLQVPSDPRVALEYEEGRVALVRRDWAAATAAFDRVIECDPGHQAAAVWRIYVRRITGRSPREAILEEIDHLFRNTELHLFGTADIRADEKDDGGGPPARRGAVVSPEVEAELLTERAALLEEGSRADLEQAVNDYERSLDRRPNMPFCHRGRVRCLVRQGKYEEADRRASETEQTFGKDLPADVQVELGRLALARGDIAQATARYAQAIQRLGTYGPAYEARIAAMRSVGDSRELRDALEEAERALQSELALSQPNRVRLELGRAYLSSGQVDDAVTAFTQSLVDETAETQDHARAGLIDAYIRLRNFRKATAEIQRAGENPGPRVRASGGWLFGELGDIKGALEWYERGLQQHPRDIGLIRGKARVLRLLGQASKARVFLEERREELPQHLAEWLVTDSAWAAIETGDSEAATALLGSRSEPAAQRGRILAACRLNRSPSALEQLVKEAVRAAGGHSETLASLWIEAGRCCVARGDVITALEYFTRANRHSGNVLLRVSQAEAFIATGALADAEAVISGIQTLDGGRYADDPAVLAVTARYRHAAGDANTAVELFERVLAAWPSSQPARIGAALAAFKGGDHESARRRLSEVVDECPDNVVAAELLAWTVLGIYERTGRADPGSGHLDEAMARCCHVREQEPRNSGAYRCLAAIASHQGRPLQAQLYLQQAARLASDDLQADKGALYLRMHRYDEAAATLKTALNVNGYNPNVCYLLGVLYFEREEPLNAVGYFRRAVALDPCDPVAREALARALVLAGQQEKALRTTTEALASLPRTDHLPLYLTRARIRYGLAGEAEGAMQDALLDDALHDIESAAGLTEDPTKKAEVEYHRGVILHRQGAVRAARAAFKRARGNPNATHALALLKEEDGSDRGETLTRRVAYALAAVALVLAAVATTVGFIDAGQGKTFASSWFPVIGVLLGFTALAGVLPRLAGFKFRGVELAVAPPALQPEPSRVVLNFGPVPLLMMSGLAPYRAPDPAPDTIGDPGTD